MISFFLSLFHMHVENERRCQVAQHEKREKNKKKTLLEGVEFIPSELYFWLAPSWLFLGLRQLVIRSSSLPPPVEESNEEVFFEIEKSRFLSLV